MSPTKVSIRQDQGEEVRVEPGGVKLTWRGLAGVIGLTAALTAGYLDVRARLSAAEEDLSSLKASVADLGSKVDANSHTLRDIELRLKQPATAAIPSAPSVARN